MLGAMVGHGSRIVASMSRAVEPGRAMGLAIVGTIGLAALQVHALDSPTVDYPSLIDHSATAEGFVPKGWSLEIQARGDLNGDGRDDLALVLRDHDPRNIIDNTDGLGPPRFDTNPRILAVAFGEGDGYRLALANHTLIPRPDNPVLDDVLSENGGVSIQRDTLRVRLHLFASAGGWTTALSTFTFRFQNDRFELIGYDRSEVQRNTGGTMAISVNYSTGRMSRTTGSIAHDRSKTSWRRLPKRPLLTLEQIGDGLDFDPTL